MRVSICLVGSPYGLTLANASSMRVTFCLLSPRPLHLVLHSTLSFHPFSSTPPPPRPFPRTIPSTLCLSGTSCVFIFELLRFFWYLTCWDISIFTRNGEVPTCWSNTQHMTRSLESRGGVDREWYTSCQGKIHQETLTIKRLNFLTSLRRNKSRYFFFLHLMNLSLSFHVRSSSSS